MASELFQNSLSESHVALELRKLSVFLQRKQGANKEGFYAVRELDLKISRGEAFGIIGESGCGKSLTARAVIGLIPKAANASVTGSVYLGSRPLHTFTEANLQQIRGKHAAIVFQDPMTALSPFYTVGFQLLETLRAHDRLSYSEARRRACHLLASVGIGEPERRLSQYPHEFSGGMRQRVVIAMALSHHPELLIADEPTTGLDAATQVEILDLLNHLRNNPNAWQQKSGHLEKMAILFISHDFSAVSLLCERLAVMYAGQIVEQGETALILKAPRHPYTKALVGCLPQWRSRAEYTMQPMLGAPPRLHSYAESSQSRFGGVQQTPCCFIDRCPRKQSLCERAPHLNEQGFRCHFPENPDA